MNVNCMWDQRLIGDIAYKVLGIPRKPEKFIGAKYEESNFGGGISLPLKTFG